MKWKCLLSASERDTEFINVLCSCLILFIRLISSGRFFRHLQLHSRRQLAASAISDFPRRAEASINLDAVQFSIVSDQLALLR